MCKKEHEERKYMKKLFCLKVLRFEVPKRREKERRRKKASKEPWQEHLQVLMSLPQAKRDNFFGVKAYGNPKQPPNKKKRTKMQLSFELRKVEVFCCCSNI